MEVPSSSLVASLSQPRFVSGRSASVASEGAHPAIVTFEDVAYFQDLEQPGGASEQQGGGLWNWWRYQGLAG